MTDKLNSESNDISLGQIITDSTNKLFQAAYDNPTTTVFTTIGLAALAYGYTKGSMFKDLVASLRFNDTLPNSNITRIGLLKVENELLPKLIVREHNYGANVHSFLPTREKPLNVMIMAEGPASELEYAILTQKTDRLGKQIDRTFHVNLNSELDEKTLSPVTGFDPKKVLLDRTTLRELDHNGHTIHYSFDAIPRELLSEAPKRALHFIGNENTETTFLFQSNGSFLSATWRGTNEIFSAKATSPDNGIPQYTFERKPIGSLSSPTPPDYITQTSPFENVKVDLLQNPHETNEIISRFKITPSLRDQRERPHEFIGSSQFVPGHIYTPSFAWRFNSEPQVSSLERAIIAKWLK